MTEYSTLSKTGRFPIEDYAYYSNPFQPPITKRLKYNMNTNVNKNIWKGKSSRAVGNKERNKNGIETNQKQNRSNKKT